LYYYTEQFNEVDDTEIKVKFAEEIFHSTLTNSDNRLFFREFCGFPIVREYFFEFLADPTFSIPNYEEGILCYLKGLRGDESVRDLRDVVFGNCLLFRHYFINQQRAKALLIGEKLFVHLNVNEHQLNDIGVFPSARYLSCKILFIELNGDKHEMREFIEWMFEWMTKRIHYQTIEEQRIIFYSVGECFLLSALIDLHFHDRLKALFSQLFDVMPNKLFHQKLHKIIPYFDQNGSIYHLLNGSNLN
jgi:hypothetical protein